MLDLLFGIVKQRFFDLAIVGQILAYSRIWNDSSEVYQKRKIDFLESTKVRKIMSLEDHTTFIESLPYFKDRLIKHPSV